MPTLKSGQFNDATENIIFNPVIGNRKKILTGEEIKRRAIKYIRDLEIPDGVENVDVAIRWSHMGFGTQNQGQLDRMNDDTSFEA